MKYYIDITLEVHQRSMSYTLWTTLYNQLHIAFADAKNKKGVEFGVSFPTYISSENARTLGNKIRIFGSRNELCELDIHKWLKRIISFLSISSVKKVPKITEFAIFKRVQPKGFERTKKDREKFIQHLMSKFNLSLEEAEKSATQKDIKQVKYPFVNVDSVTNFNNFKLFIDKIEMTHEQKGEFGTYGLSDSATVPIF